MSEEVIKNYIDFKGLFLELCKDDKAFANGSDGKSLILEFAKSMDGFEVDNEECEINDSYIVFWFGINFGGANESDPQDSGASVAITYDRDREEFNDYSYEQG